MPSSPRWPRVVAEALTWVAHPRAAFARPRRQVVPDAIHAAWQRLMAPALADAVPPSFLTRHQMVAWRRVVAACDEWNGALLIEPVGQGKTWIAMAAAIGAREVTVIGPAVLRAQWERVAQRVERPIRYWSMERLSRGKLPPGDPDLVIVDEAHRLRDPSAKRTRTLAPFLAGRRLLLLTATPVVNRLEELTNLLRLFLPEDALVLDGIPSLDTIAACAAPPVALRRVVVRSATTSTIVIPHTTRGMACDAKERARGDRAAALIRRLTARHTGGISRLLAMVLLDAAASSDAALLMSLRRYRAMLEHARDAGSSDRATIRRFAGAQLEQLVLWELVGTREVDATLPIADLALVAAEVERFIPSDSGWIAPLRQLLCDGPPVICFTRHRATATLLRTTMGDGTAWITGDSAGIGPHRLPREAILSAFGPARASWSVRRTLPHTLIATDVAAEGLDLQGAGRMIHIDLPWTAMRMEQREGRLRRIGQAHPVVDVVIRPPPLAVEREMHRLVALRRKASLASRWVDDLAVAEHDHAPLRADVLWTVVPIPAGEPPRDWVVISLTETAAGRSGSVTMTRTDRGAWRCNSSGPPDLGQQIAGMRGASPSDEALDEIIDSALQGALRACRAARPWGSVRLITRIHRLAKDAAWRRDRVLMDRLDRTLRWCSTAPTLGQRLQREALAAAPDDVLAHHEAPIVPRTGPIVPRVVAALLFRSDAAPLRSSDAPLPYDSLRS